MTLPIKDIKKHYLIFCETGLILALLILLSAFNIKTESKATYKPLSDDKNVIKVWDIPITDQPQKPKPLEPTVKPQKPEDRIFDDPIDGLEIEDNPGILTNKLPEISPEKKDKEKIFRVVEQYPSMVGGIISLYENITYPKRAKVAGIEGVVLIKFVVNKDGSVSEAKIKRGIGGGCDEEALKAVEKLTFIPGQQRGTTVRVRMSIPVRFELQN